tara:strand:- start:213 stop:470 length:258 start_codon:yes stop_codon:yes gene_type:complete
MTVLDKLKFVAFNPLQNNKPIAVRRRKLIAKIDEQIQIAANKVYTPTQQKWVTDVRLKLPSVLSIGGLLVLMERLTLWCAMEASL